MRIQRLNQSEKKREERVLAHRGDRGDFWNDFHQLWPEKNQLLYLGICGPLQGDDREVWRWRDLERCLLHGEG